MANEGMPSPKLSPEERIQTEGAFCPLDMIHLYQRTSRIMSKYQLEQTEIELLPERQLDRSTGKTIQKVKIISPEDSTLNTFFRILDAGLEKRAELELSRDELNEKRRRTLITDAMSNAAIEIAESRQIPT